MTSRLMHADISFSTKKKKKKNLIYWVASLTEKGTDALQTFFSQPQWPKRKQRFFRETLSEMAPNPNNNREFYIYPWLHMPFVVEEKQVLLH